MDILQYTFFQNAIWASLLTAIACGIVGTYIVSRRIVFISGGITHASFGGLGIGFYTGMNPLLSALIFAVLSAFGVEYISHSGGYKRIREDSVIAAVWSLGMATGVIFIFLTPGYAPNLTAYLFGNILTVSTTDILWMTVLTIILIAVYLPGRRSIMYTAFDRDFAFTQGLPVRLIEYGMMFFISATIVLSIRLVGIMLLISILTIPQMTVNIFTSNYHKITVASSILGFSGCLSGLFLSYYFNIPSGAFIILVLIVIFLIAKAIHSLFIRKEERSGVTKNGLAA
ncbi:MAG: metal ABC transporter permease [Tannerella sp.]|jgi:zinc transport system permease protein|nr:metal ABC transporter permease [Tannerella sp.]